MADTGQHEEQKVCRQQRPWSLRFRGTGLAIAVVVAGGFVLFSTEFEDLRESVKESLVFVVLKSKVEWVVRVIGRVLAVFNDALQFSLQQAARARISDLGQRLDEFELQIGEKLPLVDHLK